MKSLHKPVIVGLVRITCQKYANISRHIITHGLYAILNFYVQKYAKKYAEIFFKIAFLCQKEMEIFVKILTLCLKICRNMQKHMQKYPCGQIVKNM